MCQSRKKLVLKFYNRQTQIFIGKVKVDCPLPSLLKGMRWFNSLNETEDINNIFVLLFQVWGLDIHQMIIGFPNEHTRSNTFFRSVGSATGVTQLAIGPKHTLFSCGVDGSMKFRTLPERESIVRYWNT